MGAIVGSGPVPSCTQRALNHEQSRGPRALVPVKMGDWGEMWGKTLDLALECPYGGEKWGTEKRSTAGREARETPSE
jgi:hypothetical protein